MNNNCYYHEVAARHPETIEKIRKQVLELVEPEVIYLLGIAESSRRAETLFTTTTASMRTISHCYLLVLVDRKDDDFTLNCLQDKLETALGKFIGATVIVLTIHSFNNWLKDGHLFAYSVGKYALCIYKKETVLMQEPMTPDAEQQQTERDKLVKDTQVKVREFMAGAELFIVRKQNKMAAFMLHQAAEQALRMNLIIHTGYRMNSHSIDRLIRCCSMYCYQLPDVFPKHNEKSKRLFGLLKHAYVDTRYKNDYSIGDEDVVLMREKVQRIVSLMC